jgi:serine/threonine-protein kinase
MAKPATSEPTGDSAAGVTAATRACPREEEIVAYLERRADAEAAERLRGHLDECGRCRVTVAEGARALVQGDRRPDEGHSLRTFADGENVGDRYRVVRLLGRGGMGEVYEVEDALLGSRVALKALACSHLDNARAFGRLKAEVLLARKVLSPHVCRVLDYGVHGARTEDSIPFLTMELLHGETLAARLRRQGRLPEQQVRSLALQMLEGLRAVHAAGIVHRDFKPENVFLIADPAGGERAVVLDFGLARSIERDALTTGSTGAVMLGTPHYMAPEQVQGKAPGPATDVYALGVVLFELLTGEKPFRGSSALEVATSRLGARPPRVSSVLKVDPVWDAIVARCLEAEPQRRFGGMGELAAALSSHRPGRRLPRGPLAAGGLAAAGLVAFALLRAGGGPRDAPAPAPAPAPIAQAVPTEAPATAVAPPPTIPPPTPAPVEAAAPPRPAPRPGRRAARRELAARPTPAAQPSSAPPDPGHRETTPDEDLALPTFHSKPTREISEPFRR